MSAIPSFIIYFISWLLNNLLSPFSITMFIIQDLIDMNPITAATIIIQVSYLV